MNNAHDKIIGIKKQRNESQNRKEGNKKGKEKNILERKNRETKILPNYTIYTKASFLRVRKKLIRCCRVELI